VITWLKEILLPLIIVAALVFFGFAGGAAFVAARKNAEIADIKRTQAENEVRVAQAASKRLEDAQALGDQLTQQLLDAEAARQKLAQEKNDEIRRLTTGRRCLDAAAVRVLNNASTGSQPGALPETARQPAAEDGAAATDTDVGLWISNAWDQYETCRGRLGALIDFEEGK